MWAQYLISGTGIWKPVSKSEIRPFRGSAVGVSCKKTEGIWNCDDALTTSCLCMTVHNEADDRPRPRGNGNEKEPEENSCGVSITRSSLRQNAEHRHLISDGWTSFNPDYERCPYPETRTHTLTHAHTHARTYARTNIRTHACIYTRTHARMHTHARRNAHARTH